MSDSRCPGCGSVLEADTKFCGVCGTTIPSLPEVNVEFQGEVASTGLLNKSLGKLPFKALDNGTFFNRGFFYALVIMGVVFGIIEMFGLIYGLFKDGGYFPSLGLILSDATFFGLRSMFCSLLTFVVSVFGLAIMVGIVWRRSVEIRGCHYRGITVVMTSVFRMLGEMLAVVPLIVAINVFLGLLLLTVPVGIPFGHLPLTLYSGFVERFVGVFQVLPLFSLGTVSSGQEYAMVCLGGGLASLVCGAACAFGLLVTFYWLAEIVGVFHGFLIHKPLFSKD